MPKRLSWAQRMWARMLGKKTKGAPLVMNIKIDCKYAERQIEQLTAKIQKLYDETRIQIPIDVVLDGAKIDGFTEEFIMVEAKSEKGDVND